MVATDEFPNQSIVIGIMFLHSQKRIQKTVSQKKLKAK